MDRSTVDTKLRSYLRRLANSRKSGTVTADDVHTFVQRNNIRMSPSEQISLTRRVLNENNSFFVVGSTSSTRPVARGRQISEWQYLS